jgi:hypothetical protein
MNDITVIHSITSSAGRGESTLTAAFERYGRLGGADKITAPDDRLPIGDVVEAKVLAQLRPGRQFLGTNGGAVAESLGRRDGVLDQGRQVT